MFNFRDLFYSSALSGGSAGGRLNFVQLTSGETALAVENVSTGRIGLFELSGGSDPVEFQVASNVRLLTQLEPTPDLDQQSSTRYLYLDPQNSSLGELTFNVGAQNTSATTYSFVSEPPPDITDALSVNVAGSNFFILSVENGSEIRVYERLEGTQLQASSIQGSSYTPDSGSITQLSHSSAGTTDRIFVLNSETNTLSSFEIAPNGALHLCGEIGAETGLGINQPTEFEVVECNGKTFLLLAATMTSSLSVVRVLQSGELIETDHVIDGAQSRFDRLVSFETIEVSGRFVVILAGADGGLSALELLPNGRLTEIAFTGADPGIDLGNVTSVTAREVDGDIQIFMLAENRPEVIQFDLDLPQFGVTLDGDSGANVLSGTDLADLISGGRGDDHLSGGAGRDVLIDGAGQDTLVGGEGSDTFVIANDNDQDLILDFNPQQDFLDLSAIPQVYSITEHNFEQTAAGAILTLAGVELHIHSHDGAPLDLADIQPRLLNGMYHIAGSAAWSGEIIEPQTYGGDLIGTTGRDLAVGDDGNNRAVLGTGDDRGFGGAGNDRMEGGAGDDELHGDTGDDVLFGGSSGQDMLVGGDGADSAYGESDDDLLILGNGHDLGFGGDGDDRIEGGAGNDRLHGEAGDDLLLGGITGNDTLVGGSGHDLAYGESGNDLLIGGAGDDRLFGGDGDDRIEGGQGADLLSGGDGDDLIFAGSGTDVANGMEGNDVIYGEDQNDILRGNGGNDSLFGGTGNDHLEGGIGDDRLFGEEGNDLLFGGANGIDHLVGGGGDDIAYGEDQADVLQGGAGVDRLFGGAGNDRLEGGIGADIIFGEGDDDLVFGGDGNDLITGGAGDDVLHGQAGNDTIFAGTGNNVVSGGAGLDMFVFNNGDGGSTRIVDFEGDIIDIRQITTITGFQDLVDNHITEVDGNLHISIDDHLIIIMRMSVDELDLNMFMM